MRFINSLNHAFAGIVHAFKNEGNMKIHVVVALLTVLAAVLTYSTRYEMIALSITITFVFLAEMLNTAVEAVVEAPEVACQQMRRVCQGLALLVSS